MFVFQRISLSLAALALVAAAGLSAGCSKIGDSAEVSDANKVTQSDKGLEHGGASSATSASGSANDPAPRAAKYDPNLVPRNVVWDDPAKQREWEVRQAKKRAAAAQQTQGATPAPANVPSQAPTR